MMNIPEDAPSAGTKTLGPSPFETRFSPEDLGVIEVILLDRCSLGMVDKKSILER